MLKPWLTTTEQRAKDLQTTLANFDGRNLARPDGKDAVLTAFQKLSKQCSLLERQSDQNSSIMLERHFAVPTTVAGLDPARGEVAMVPHLLSTTLEKEQEDRAAKQQRQAEGSSSSDDASIEAHNATVKAAQEHLARTASALVLPGAQALAKASGIQPAGGGFRSLGAPAPTYQPLSASAPSYRSLSAAPPAYSSLAAAPPAQPAHEAEASKLIAALRSGVGLEIAEGEEEDEEDEEFDQQPADKPVRHEGAAEEGSPASKRPRL